MQRFQVDEDVKNDLAPAVNHKKGIHVKHMYMYMVLNMMDHEILH